MSARAAAAAGGGRPVKEVILSRRADPPALILASRRSRRRRICFWAGVSSIFFYITFTRKTCYSVGRSGRGDEVMRM